MQKILKRLLNLSSIIFGLLILLPQSIAFAASIPSNPTVDAFKNWNITFSSDLNFNTVSKKNITVTDNSGKLVTVDLNKNSSNSIIVNAPSSGYTAGKTYTLSISSNVQSSNNKSLLQPINMKFSVKTSSQNYSYGIVKQMDDSKIVVATGAAGEKNFDYTDDWQKYVETSIVMFDGSGKLTSYDDQNLKQDNIFDFKSSIIKFSNLSDKYTLADDALIVLVSKDGKYVSQGTSADVSKAADNEKFVRALVAPNTNVVKAITIEQ